MNCAVMSTGFRTAPNAGTTRRSASRVASPSSGTRRPSSSQRSAIRTPAPPDWVTIPTPGPAGSGQLAKAATRSRSCSSFRARMIPAWPKTPLYTRSAPASDPVCDDAARAPAPERATFTITIGLPRASARAAAAMTLRPSFNPSM